MRTFLNFLTEICWLSWTEQVLSDLICEMVDADIWQPSAQSLLRAPAQRRKGLARAPAQRRHKCGVQISCRTECASADHTTGGPTVMSLLARVFTEMATAARYAVERLFLTYI